MKTIRELLLLTLVVGPGCWSLAATDSADDVINSIFDLENIYRMRQSQIPPIPSHDVWVDTPTTVYRVDWKKFPKDFTAMMYAEMDALTGSPLYCVTCYEDYETRETVFLNSYDEEVYRLPPVKGYDPLPSLAGLDSFNAWIFDPAHTAVQLTLIPELFYEDYQTTKEEQVVMAAMPMMMAMSAPVMITNLMLEIEPGSNGVDVALLFPAGYTNPVDVFSCSDLMDWDWSPLTNVSSAGRSDYSWSADTTGQTRFWVAARSDLQSDSDGVSDSYEIYLLGTDPGDSDTDGDGIDDGSDAEPLVPDANQNGLADGIDQSLAASISANGTGGVMVIVPGTGWYHAIDPDHKLIFLGDE